MNVVEALKPRVAIMKLYGLSQIDITKDNRVTTLSTGCIVYGVFLILVTFLGTAITMILKCYFEYPSLVATAIVVDAVENLLLPWLMLARILMPVLTLRMKLKRVLDTLLEVDILLSVHQDEKHLKYFERLNDDTPWRNYFSLGFFIAFFSAGSYSFLRFGTDVKGPAFLWCHILQVCCLACGGINCNYFAIMLRLFLPRFKMVCYVWKENLKVCFKYVAGGENVPDELIEKINHCRIVHNKLVIGTECLNDALGHSVLSWVFEIVADTVLILSALAFSKFDKSLPTYTDQGVVFFYLGATALVFFKLSILCCVIYFCERVKTEGNSITPFMVNLDTEFFLERQIELIDIDPKLDSYIKVFAEKPITFNAAVFEILPSTIFQVLGVIVSYFVIILQVEGLLK